ncbi:methyl-accepting chemotaxis protein [Siminovitchia fortis]|uniref:methyl-accepting chemotaxis protein n=1 Tax=Siminovitchia fortis TaxID=254758 RepID=UPI001ABEFD04|nr:methyl-accepting chemotaxis protein [Siminovitchia fortis]WHY83518.1 methyl-accepting chemotaxis protein [Siminovitchia fortis]
MKFFNWYYNLKTATKILSVFVIIAFIQIGANLFGLSNLGKMNSSIDDMYNERMQPMDYIYDTRFLFQELRVKWRDANTSDSSETFLNEVNDIRADMEKNIETYSKSALTNEQKKLVDDFWPEWAAFNETYDKSVREIIDGKKDIQSYDVSELDTHQTKIIGMLDQLKESGRAVAEQEHKNADHMYSSTKVVMIIILTLISLFSIVMGLWTSRVIVRPLRQVVGLVEQVADGDLTETADIRTKDEVGILARSVNTMVLNLREMVQNILGAAENLSASSEQVSASTEEIASASSNQANAAQTMNELFRELSDAINAVAQNTEQAAELANKTMQIAQDGEKVVLSSVDGANVVSEQMASLEQDSNRIGEIIEVIDDIADQTNLLALNAAIEAARAGEQGRGFAVVADEVRKLAERSGEATKQITAIIKGMQENTALSVKSVQKGLAYTRKSGEAFENIIHMVNDTGNKVTEIAGASEEQAAQSAEVLTFIESISAATEEATASSEETASTAQSLTDLAEELNASVAAFKIN